MKLSELQNGLMLVNFNQKSPEHQTRLVDEAQAFVADESNSAQDRRRIENFLYTINPDLCLRAVQVGIIDQQGNCQLLGGK